MKIVDPRLQTPASAGSASQVDLARYAWLLAQLGLLALLVHLFRIESESFQRLMVLTVGGFAVHYFLPLRYRLPFFVALSLAGIGLVLGVTQTAWLVALGLGLIGLAHLPVPFWGRVAALLAAGLVLAPLRWGLGWVPWSNAVWPLLGSFFVFRLIIYLYDCRYKAGPTRLSQTLGYFFLLPNVCFPLFPVVDFKRFCRNYYDAERHGIYQVGVNWILRGITHLLAYRFVYHFVTLDSADVSDLATLVQYVVSTFLLYVRISGQFHLAVGMLHLFGFNLPETNHKYFLASSFTDFWRRINIYWKDFMLKVFYYPAYFMLRRMGDTWAIVLATVFTFFVTWLLHAVQWFWIRGGVFLEANDIIFWSIFGGLVLVNSLYEAGRGRARSLTRRARTLGESVGLVARTVGTFTVICVLWSLWTAESVSDWLHLMSMGRVPPADPTWLIVWTALALVVATVAVLWLWKGEGITLGRPLVLARSAATAATMALLFAMLAAPAASEGAGDAGRVVESLRSQSLNRRDAGQFQRGYYENLLAIGRFNDELQRVYEAMPADFVRSLSRLGLTRNTGDALGYEMLPHKEGVFVGALVRTNAWGMRDRELPLARPLDVYRIALLGASHAMGSGVPQNETFEALVEARLNEWHGSPPRRYEVLNFGVAGYTPLQILVQLRQKVQPFDPQLTIYVAHNTDAQSVANYWSGLARRGALPEEAFLYEIQRRSGVDARRGPNETRRRSKPYEHDLLEWTYRAIVAECRNQRTRPLLLYLPFVSEQQEVWRAPDRRRTLKIAAEAGFHVIDLSNVYDGHPPSTLWLTPGDGHPNARGSRLIADELFDALRALVSE